MDVVHVRWDSLYSAASTLKRALSDVSRTGAPPTIELAALPDSNGGRLRVGCRYPDGEVRIRIPAQVKAEGAVRLHSVRFARLFGVALLVHLGHREVRIRTTGSDALLVEADPDFTMSVQCAAIGRPEPDRRPREDQPDLVLPSLSLSRLLRPLSAVTERGGAASIRATADGCLRAAAASGGHAVVTTLTPERTAPARFPELLLPPSTVSVLLECLDHIDSDVGIFGSDEAAIFRTDTWEVATRRPAEVAACTVPSHPLLEASASHTQLCDLIAVLEDFVGVDVPVSLGFDGSRSCSVSYRGASGHLGMVLPLDECRGEPAMVEVNSFDLGQALRALDGDAVHLTVHRRPFRLVLRDERTVQVLPCR